MSGGFPFWGQTANVQEYGSLNASGGASGTTVTAGSTANSKGAWTQCVAATVADIVVLSVKIGNWGAVAPYAVDIGFGASGSEQVLFNNLLYNEDGGQDSEVEWKFPCSIPAGSRIAARAQCAATGGEVYVSLHGEDGSFAQSCGSGGVDAIGFDLSSTVGTAIAPAASAKGSWTQLVASTARDYAGFSLGVDAQGGFFSYSPMWLDIGFGASGSEIVLVPNFTVFRNSTFKDIMPNASNIFSIPIPAGTRIAARAECLSSNLSAFGLTLYGIAR